MSVSNVCTIPSEPCGPSTLSQDSVPGVGASCTPSIVTPRPSALLR